jgi:hypothetical protein
MMHALCNLICGALMYACFVNQPRFNRAFAVLAALFFGLTGLATRGGIPQVLQHPATVALGRAIVGEQPPPKRTH